MNKKSKFDFSLVCLISKMGFCYLSDFSRKIRNAENLDVYGDKEV